MIVLILILLFVDDDYPCYSGDDDSFGDDVCVHVIKYVLMLAYIIIIPNQLAYIILHFYQL